MVPDCTGYSNYPQDVGCNCGSTGCSANCDYPSGTSTIIIVTYSSNKYEELMEEVAQTRWHPGPKELRKIFPEIKVKPHKVIFAKPKFNRKLLFSFSGYLPKRVRRRVQ